MPSDATASAGHATYAPSVRKIGMDDIKQALTEGFADFLAIPTFAVFVALIYPVVGLILGRFLSGSNALPLLFPLVGGFALIGPFGAVGLYEFSRLREQGKRVSLFNTFDILRSDRIAAILLLGAMLGGLFVVWMVVAETVYMLTLGGIMGPAGAPLSPVAFIDAVLYTSAGHALIVVGTGLGFLFAVAVLALGVVSFPLLVDTDKFLGTSAAEQASVAVRTSVRAAVLNPIPMAMWGIIVAGLLILGSLPFLVGLAVVMPLLAHSTWHLYRKLVV